MVPGGISIGNAQKKAPLLNIRGVGGLKVLKALSPFNHKPTFFLMFGEGGYLHLRRRLDPEPRQAPEQIPHVRRPVTRTNLTLQKRAVVPRRARM